MVQIADDGWDSRAYVADDVWLVREPRRPEVAPWLLMETELLPWLSPLLPLAVPVPEVVKTSPLRVRHRLVPGVAARSLDDNQGLTIGRFLAVLHAVDVDAAVVRGVRSAAAATADRSAQVERFRSDVLPRLERPLWPSAEALLVRLGEDPPEVSLVHGDLGPPHILSDQRRVTGVIDWSDAHIGDPALDLAWLLNASGAGDAVADAYGADEDTVTRARDWHLLGPWHEVVHGMDTDRPHLVATGIDGVRSRLQSG